MEIIVKNYSHYNRTLGKYISTKRQYLNELKRGGYVPFEEGCRLAESKKEAKYKPSKECVDMMREVLHKNNKKIILGQHPKLVEGMKKLGVSFDTKWLPKHYQDKGGFENAVD